MTHSVSYSDDWELADWKSPLAPLIKGGIEGGIPPPKTNIQSS